MAWSPDGRFVVTGSADRTARIWSVVSGDEPAVLVGHDDRVHAVAWSPDGTRIATASYDRTVRIWDTRSRTEIGVVGVHRDRLTCVAWTADSRSVITGSYDGTVRVWKAEVDLDELMGPGPVPGLPCVDTRGTSRTHAATRRSVERARRLRA